MDINKATDGDQDVIADLLHRQFATLKRFVESRIPIDLRSILSADDVLQDAFVDVFRDIGSFQALDENSFEAWVQTIVGHRLFDAIRKLRRQKRGGKFLRRENNADLRSSIGALINDLNDVVDRPSQLAAREEAIDEMQVAITALPDDQRDAIVYRFVDLLTVEETAERMDRTPGAVRGLVQRGSER